MKRILIFFVIAMSLAGMGWSGTRAVTSGVTKETAFGVYGPPNYHPHLNFYLGPSEYGTVEDKKTGNTLDNPSYGLFHDGAGTQYFVNPDNATTQNMEMIIKYFIIAVRQ